MQHSFVDMTLQVWISSTFYIQIFFCTNVISAAWSLALNALSYKKCVRKTLMKLTAGVNFIKILQHIFLNDSNICSFYELLKFLLRYLAKKIGPNLLVKWLQENHTSLEYTLHFTYTSDVKVVGFYIFWSILQRHHHCVKSTIKHD